MNIKIQLPTIPGNKNANHGQAAVPQVSSKNNKSKASPRNAFAERIQRQAAHRMRTSPDYDKVIADCIAHYEAQKEIRPSSASLSWTWPEFDSRIAALLLALLILFGTILAGCKTVEALHTSPLSNRSAVIDRKIAE